MNKFNARKTVCLSHHVHDSQLEADYCNVLLSDEQAGRIWKYAVHVPYDLGAGIKHVVDFVIEKNTVDGPRKEVHDCKGVLTPTWRLKLKLFKEKFSDVPYFVVQRYRGVWNIENKGTKKKIGALR